MTATSGLQDHTSQQLQAQDACGVHVLVLLGCYRKQHFPLTLSLLLSCPPSLRRITGTPPSWLAVPHPVQGQQQTASRAQPFRQQQQQQRHTIVTDNDDDWADDVDECDSGSSESDFQPSKKPRGIVP
jgi:hypothetical protein